MFACILMSLCHCACCWAVSQTGSEDSLDEMLMGLNLGGLLQVSTSDVDESDSDELQVGDGAFDADSAHKSTGEDSVRSTDPQLHEQDSDIYRMTRDDDVNRGHAAEARQVNGVNWQAEVEELFNPRWPNNNWCHLSRLLNIIGSSDLDADVLLETIRQLDWTISIPKNIAELRKIEIDSLGTNK